MRLHISTRPAMVGMVAAVTLCAVAVAAASSARLTFLSHGQTKINYPPAHFTIQPLSLRLFDRPLTSRDRAGQTSSVVTESVDHLFASSPGLPDAYDPGQRRPNDLRVAVDGVGTANRTVYMVRTTNGRVCAGLTGFSAGCLEGLPDTLPVTAVSADPDANGTGEAPLVWGIAKDDVVAVDVVVNGKAQPALLARNAYFFQLADAALPDRAIEGLIVRLSNGSTFRQDIDHGPTGDLPTTVGPPESQPH